MVVVLDSTRLEMLGTCTCLWAIEGEKRTPNVSLHSGLVSGTFQPYLQAPHPMAPTHRIKGFFSRYTSIIICTVFKTISTEFTAGAIIDDHWMSAISIPGRDEDERADGIDGRLPD
jgi:hypothetical protein